MKLLVLLVVVAVVIIGQVVWSGTRPTLSPIASSVLGITSLPDQTHFNSLVIPSNTIIPEVPASPTPTATPPPTIEKSVITLIGGPGELFEGDVATFTWDVGGPAKAIHTTTIYYGSMSAPGGLGDYVSPVDVRYTFHVQDFFQGNYDIPMRFVGNIHQLVPGTYYYRAYALIDGKHYWSEERIFVVKQIPKHTIIIVNPPTILSPGANATFTWDVYGPAATTGFTTIVGGRQSKPEVLGPTTDISKTPYTILVKDFITGTYAVPLRFIGNAIVGEPGIYYFRALAFINDKNIWSDEYSFTVQ